jgi:phenylpropionate dioxygenase-like ring-hydroxylating dioxygenase large terminal subunit
MRLITKSGWGLAVANTETSQAVSPALETRLYRDPEVLEQEQVRIFARRWQFVGHVSQLPEPGGYITASAGVEPVLVIRDDAARAF